MKHQAELYRLLIESVTDYAIFALGPTGLVLSWNPGAQRLKGYLAAEIIGQPFTKFYPAEAVASGFPQHELEVAAREGRFEDEGWRVRKDGSRFWANVIISAIKDANGRVLGFAKVTRDLTARREAEEQARQLAGEQAARAEAQRRSEELARLNEQLQEQAAELEVQAEELEAFVVQQQEANQQLQDALAAADSARSSTERLRMSTSALNILLVADDEADAMSVKEALDTNHIVNPLYLARDGVEALRMLRSGQVPRDGRLVLLDVNMHGSSGVEFLQDVRSDPELKGITIIMLTTSDSDREKIGAGSRDISGYLAKPVTFSEFAAVAVAVGLRWSLLAMSEGVGGHGGTERSE